MAVRRAPLTVIKRVWERIAPLQLAETSWDNVGVIIESPFPTEDAKQVLLTIDLTTRVCEEALALPSCSVVIAYHPPIFRGLKSLTLDDPLQASLLKLAARGISVFSPHTSVDATPKGVNNWLVEPFEALAESPATPVSLIDNPPAGFEGAGMGKIVQLKESLPVGKVVEIVKKHLGLESVQLATPSPEREIRSIAVCAGSGGSVLRGVSSDLLLTGEMSHHEVLAAVAAGKTIILCNHSNTERPYLNAVLKGWLQKELDKDEKGWEVFVSKTDMDPLRTV